MAQSPWRKTSNSSDSQEGKALPLQARSGPESSRKLWFPDFVTTAKDGGRLSALRTGRLYPQEVLLVLISVRADIPRNLRNPKVHYLLHKSPPLSPALNQTSTVQVRHLILLFILLFLFSPLVQKFYGKTAKTALG